MHAPSPLENSGSHASFCPAPSPPFPGFENARLARDIAAMADRYVYEENFTFFFAWVLSACIGFWKPGVRVTLDGIVVTLCVFALRNRYLVVTSSVQGFLESV